VGWEKTSPAAGRPACRRQEQISLIVLDYKFIS